VFVEALMQPGVDLEVDPLERARRTPERETRISPPIKPGHGTTPGPCVHCGRDVGRRHAGLCGRCYKRMRRAAG
jgi:hypothetical protein